MSPYLAGGLLTLALGAILARPEAGPLRTAAAAGPGTTIRRVLPALIAVPVIAALVSALAVRTGVSRPAAAVSTGAILAALAVLALVGYLVRSLEGADRQQRELVAELHERQEFAAMLLQSMNEAVMVLDANYRVLDVNRRWHELDRPPRGGRGRIPPGGPAAARHRGLADPARRRHRRAGAGHHGGRPGPRRAGPGRTSPPTPTSPTTSGPRWSSASTPPS